MNGDLKCRAIRRAWIIVLKLFTFYLHKIYNGSIFYMCSIKGWVHDERSFSLGCTITLSTTSCKLAVQSPEHIHVCVCVQNVPGLRQHFLTFHSLSISLLLNLIVLRALGAAGRYTALISGRLIASFGFGPVSKCCCCLGRHFCQNRAFFIIRLLKHPLLPANSRAAHCQRERRDESLKGSKFSLFTFFPK